MGKELSRICQVSSVGVLADQMAEAEQSKSEVETLLQERVIRYLSVWIIHHSCNSDEPELLKLFENRFDFDGFIRVLDPSFSWIDEIDPFFDGH